LIAAVLAFCVLLLPPIARAESGFKLDKADLVTRDDFLQYASVHEVNVHELYFSTILYEGTESCLMCHEEEARGVLDMGHFKWQGETDQIAGVEGQVFGKNQLLNNFCIAVPSNEGRCTQCHTGYGYADAGFDFNDPKNIDCLVCHDQSGTYKKELTTAGMPDPSVDLNVVARSISLGGTPTRKNCIGCHANAGGGDNVKHGDLSTDLVATTREFDVHMGTDGANFDCVDCHAANHDPKSGEVNHGNAGMSLHSVSEGEMRQCTECHGGLTAVHDETPVGVMFEDGWHERLACQVCHIPAIARAMPTKMEWYWADAGQDIEAPIDPETGKPTYAKKKGSFVWKKNVRPTLRFSNGKWERMVINISDKYTEEPIQLATPLGNRNDPEAMIYPFKLMSGNQPVDPVTHTVLVPHLFGPKGGPNPYWKKYDWNLALQDGAAYTGQDYSGEYAFAATEMLLSVNHEVAPAEQALGYLEEGGGCSDCHQSGEIDWSALGWTGDPTDGGEREAAAAAAPTNRIGLE
jgi:octaheme c-type cytochrome (tetrathionate reductase family)